MQRETKIVQRRRETKKDIKREKGKQDGEICRRGDASI